MTKVNIERILYPTDFSPFSVQALRHALAFAKLFQARLKVVHVIPEVFLRGESVYASASWLLTPEIRQNVEEEMRRFLQPARDARIDHETEIRSGDPWKEVLLSAEEMPADLVVLGTHGHGGLDRFVLGSVAEKLIRRLPCPVMSVSQEEGRTWAAPGLISRILCAFDFSDTSNQSLDLAIAIASRNGAEVTLLHVIELFPDVKAITYGASASDDPSHRDLERHAVSRLQKVIAEADIKGVRIEPRAVVGRAYKEILRIAASETFDLIMIGAQGHGAIEHFLFGSNAQHIVRAATCPVLTVRAPKHDRPLRDAHGGGLQLAAAETASAT
ncbi:MAG: universal stress protein [Vicinamibacteria bacterium]